MCLSSILPMQHFVLKYSIFSNSQVFMYVTMFILFFSVSSSDLRCYSDMHQEHTQLTTALIIYD